MKALDLAVPQGVCLITFGTDFQVDRCEVEFVGFGEGEETWGLGYVVLPGDYTKMYQQGRPWAYDPLEGLLTRQFVREDGLKMTVAAGGFDTGYAPAQRALYQYLRPRFGRRYYACKGASTPWAPVWARGRPDERIRLFILGTNRLKALIYQRATISVPGPGYMHIPRTDDYSEEWFKQLLAENSYTKRDRGVEMQIFQMPKSPSDDSSSHNEALDIRVLAHAALYIRGPVQWGALQKQLQEQAAELKGNAPKKEEPRQKKSRSEWLDWKR